MAEKKNTPVTPEPAAVPTEVQTVTEQAPVEGVKKSKLKVAFLYVLIGGLAISALISIVAILIGEFNDVVQKALATTFIFVTHSLLILALVSADRNDSIGKSLFATTIFTAVILNMLTTTLGTWGVWGDDISWRAFLFFVLAIGSSFIATGILKLRVAHRPTKYSVYGTVGVIAALTLVLIPWIFAHDPSSLGDFYYRLIGALTILGVTMFALSVIFNRIAVSQNPALKENVTKSPDISGGLLAIYIVLGTFVGFIWIIGMVALITSADMADNDHYVPSHQRYDSEYRYDRY